MHPLPRLIVTLISIYFLVIIVYVIAFWLNTFEVIDPSEPVTGKVYTGLEMLTNPVLNPIRALLPDLGGLDISPALALVGLWFIQYGIIFYASPRRAPAGPRAEKPRPAEKDAAGQPALRHAAGNLENQPLEKDQADNGDQR